MKHPDEHVQVAVTRLLDALCSWERSTGVGSVLILREASGFEVRAQDGKPLSIDVSDENLLGSIR
jgi:hypothetical protein